MRLSGQSQAELIKAALVIATAGVIVYYGKKFVDSVTAKIPDVASIPEKIVTAVGDAVGSAGAAALEATKSGIEKASENIAQSAPSANTPIAVNVAKVQKASGFAMPLGLTVAAATSVSLGEKLLQALGLKSKSYGVNYENQQF